MYRSVYVHGRAVYIAVLSTDRTRPGCVHSIGYVHGRRDVFGYITKEIFLTVSATYST